tara:strand:- start:579 stop:701 length:123 start_codon:yes stop_codon:yes gene_type:complete
MKKIEGGVKGKAEAEEKKDGRRGERRQEGGKTIEREGMRE